MKTRDITVLAKQHITFRKLNKHLMATANEKKEHFLMVENLAGAGLLGIPHCSLPQRITITGPMGRGC
jgi:hypothetical protein